MTRAIIATILLCLFAWAALARDSGQWDATPADVRMWFQHLMQPDNPQSSCCGESDAYWADSFEMSSTGEYVAIITDERADAPLGRHHLEVGTRITVPNHKIKFDQGNPTGHGVVFTGLVDGDPHHVYCYVAPGGV